MSESLVYEFYVSTNKQGSDVKEEIDLIAEGYVGSLAEWEVVSIRARVEVLDNVLASFILDNTENGWVKA